MSLLAKSGTSLAVQDAATAVVWLIATVALVRAAWQWSRRLFPKDTPLEHVGHALLLSWAGVVVVATALGAAHALSSTLLLASVGTLSGIALLVSYKQPPFTHWPSQTNGRAEKAWLVAWVALWGIWISHVATSGLAGFPHDWDSLAYHIPLVDQWIQAGSLWATGSDRWANPGNNELLALWVVAPFSGDFLIAFNNLPSSVLLGCSATAVACQMGLSRGLSNLTGLIVSTHLVVFRQLDTQENDVAAAACFLAALAYAFRDLEQERSSPWLLGLGAIALGLLAGVKYYALGYAALVFTVWLAMAGTAGGVSSTARVLAVGLGGLFIFGGFWYIRNWLEAGTPFYPKGFLGSADLLELMYPDAYKSSFFGNGRPGLLGLFVKAVLHQAGPYPLAAFALTPVSTVWLLASAVHRLRRGADPAARARLGLVAVLVGSGLLFGITPMAVEDMPGTLNQLHLGYCPARYGLCFLTVATVASVIVFGDLFRCLTGGMSGLVGKTVGALLLGLPVLLQVVSVVRNMSAHGTSLYIVVANVLAIVLPILLAPSLYPRGRGVARIMAIAVLAGGAWGGYRLSERWHNGFVIHYERRHPFGGLGVYARNSTAPKTILMLQYRCYPFFGPAREHRIYQPIYAPSGEWLMKMIRSKRIDMVVVEVMEARHRKLRCPAFEECLRANPNHFRLLYDGGYSLLFEVANVP